MAWSWLGVADQDEPGATGVGGVEQAGEGAGADHRRFVDDEHGAVVEPFRAGVEVEQQLGDGS